MASGSSGLASVGAAAAGGRSSNDKKLLVGAAVGAGAVVVATCVYLYRSGWYDRMAQRVAWTLNSHLVRARKLRRPQYIIMVRHGQSEGNVDQGMFARKPDSAMKLTKKGRKQAAAAGLKLAKFLGPRPRRMKVIVSPYERTRETCEHLLEAYCKAGGSKPLTIREDPRLREQEFGNFQDPEAIQLAKTDRARFGRFWYRFDGGESGADVYDRVTAFLESLYRIMENDNRSECDVVLLVSHGLTMRLFLMRTVAKFSKVANPKNAEMWVLEKTDRGSFQLKTDIRFWM